MLLALLAMACEDTAPPQPPPAAPPQAVPSTTASVVYSAQNIDTLMPQPPTRQGTTPAPLRETAIYTEALEILGGIVDERAADPGNPWAISHGLLARGSGFTLTNGANAVDWLFAEYGEELEAGGHTLVRFPAARGDIRIEPHTDLILKALTEAGVDPTRPVTVQGHPHTVADLYRGSLLRSALDPYNDHSSYASTDDISWATQGLAAWSPPGLTWVALDGTAMSMDNLAAFNVAVLVSETEFLDKAMKAGADFERRGQGIFHYTCGGAHLLQGAGYALARGFGPDSLRAAFAQQIPMSFYRLPRELAIYDAAAKRFGTTHANQLMVQRLKFTGHFLESMHKLAALGLYVPDTQQQAYLEGAARQVAGVAKALQTTGLLDDLDAVREADEQLYLDIVGDSAHAIRGLELALGRASIAY